MVEGLSVESSQDTLWSPQATSARIHGGLFCWTPATPVLTNDQINSLLQSHIPPVLSLQQSSNDVTGDVLPKRIKENTASVQQNKDCKQQLKTLVSTEDSPTLSKYTTFLLTPHKSLEIFWKAGTFIPVLWFLQGNSKTIHSSSVEM